MSPVDPYHSQLITDYLAYNTPYVLRDAEQLFDLQVGGLDSFMPGPLRQGPRFVPSETKTGGKSVLDAAKSSPGIGYSTQSEENDGFHWVGDLTGEFEIEVQSDSGLLMLDLIEFGIHFQCTIDVATGEAKVQALDGERPLPVFDGKEQVVASTRLKGKGSYQIEMANFDEQIVLWVNRRLVELDGAYDVRQVRNGTARRPYWSPEDPLDAAPVGIGGQDIALKVESAHIYRDIYYIAVQPGGNFTDFPRDRISLSDAIPDTVARAGVFTARDVISAVYAHPQVVGQYDTLCETWFP